MHNHFTNKLLNLEDVIVKKVVRADTFVKIYIETKPKEHISYRHWSKEILHAFKYKFISNCPTEGFNNKIKVLPNIKMPSNAKKEHDSKNRTPTIDIEPYLYMLKSGI